MNKAGPGQLVGWDDVIRGRLSTKSMRCASNTGSIMAIEATVFLNVIQKNPKLMTYIRAFMTHGHLKADLDPLKLDEAYAEMDLGGTYGHPNAHMQKLTDYKYYGFTEADLDR